jgi:hypothetical protein
VRRKKAEPVEADIVPIDKCSMIDSTVMRYIRQYLKGRDVLFSGDPAQLPPVGEIASESFFTPSFSHLEEIVRKAADNPIIATAYRIRTQQGGPERCRSLTVVIEAGIDHLIDQVLEGGLVACNCGVAKHRAQPIAEEEGSPGLLAAARTR